MDFRELGEARLMVAEATEQMGALVEACEAVLEWAYADIFTEQGTLGYFAEHVVPMVEAAVERAKS